MTLHEVVLMLLPPHKFAWLSCQYYWWHEIKKYKVGLL